MPGTMVSWSPTFAVVEKLGPSTRSVCNVGAVEGGGGGGETGMGEITEGGNGAGTGTDDFRR